MIVGAVDCGDKSKARYFTAVLRAASWGRATGDNGTRWGDPSTVGAVRPLFQGKPQACPEVSLALLASVSRARSIVEPKRAPRARTSRGERAALAIET